MVIHITYIYFWDLYVVYVVVKSHHLLKGDKKEEKNVHILYS